MHRKSFAVLLASLVAALGACGGDEDGGGVPYVDDGQLVVMTRNLYLGADLTPILEAQSPLDFIAATTQAWANVQANDFTARAVALAKEIESTRPELIGLQEVSLWRTQTPGDAAVGGFTPATNVAYDFLGILLGELSKLGVTYVPVVTLSLSDFEAPISSGQDVRLTDRDVILALAGVPVSRQRQTVYTNLLQVTVAGFPVSIGRGWTAVDTVVGGQPITFVNTHLEAEGPPAVRVAQAGELMSALLAETGRVVLVGDLNSAPDTEGHLAATQAGFSDVWSALHPPQDVGFTCCFPELLAETRPLFGRIDDVLTRGALTPVSADVVGEETADKTATGLWPSDHAGVAVTVRP